MAASARPAAKVREGREQVYVSAAGACEVSRQRKNPEFSFAESAFSGLQWPSLEAPKGDQGHESAVISPAERASDFNAVREGRYRK